jgi:hypothetical protein
VQAGTVLTLSWDQVRSWRMDRHLLDRPAGVGAVEVVRRLAGVQAQVTSSARQAVAVRGAVRGASGVADALADRSLVRTWAQRGTLHLLPSDEVAAHLALLAAARTWEKAPWQREFATAGQIAEMAEAAAAALDGRVLSRAELAAEIVERTGDPALAERLGSGWGTVLKPLAWQGVLCNAVADDDSVAFTAPASWLPGWTGLPEPDAAAAVVIPTYLGVHGPATPELFDQWLIRGSTPKKRLRGWFAALAEEGVLSEVDVEGEHRWARSADLDDLAAAHPTDRVRLLPAFDQFVLGPGTSAAEVVAPERRKLVSKAAGWISPVVVAGGRVAGVWSVDGPALAVTLFPEHDTDRTALDAEIGELARALDTELEPSVRSA